MSGREGDWVIEKPDLPLFLSPSLPLDALEQISHNQRLISET
jgi:hypothetical protein